MNKLKWHIINRREAQKYNTHYLYINVRGDVAIADHSIRNLSDPASTDDGLLIWSGGPLHFDWKNSCVFIPVYTDKDVRNSVPTSMLTALRMGQALGKNLWPDNDEWPFAVQLRELQDFYFANLKLEAA